MKKESNKLFASINSTEMVELTNIVKESLAAEIQAKTFSAAQLWNIQRNKKSVSVRRFSF